MERQYNNEKVVGERLGRFWMNKKDRKKYWMKIVKDKHQRKNWNDTEENCSKSSIYIYIERENGGERERERERESEKERMREKLF